MKFCKQGFYRFRSGRHDLCAKTQTWPFIGELMGLKVQIVEPGPYYRPYQSHDNGTTLVRARCLVSVGVDFESDNYMISFTDDSCHRGVREH